MCKLSSINKEFQESANSSAQGESSVYQDPATMNSNMSPDQTNQTNTTFIEQRALNVESAQMRNVMTMSNEVEKEMPDVDWMAKQQLMKPVILKQYAWSSSDSVGSVIGQFEFPSILSSVDSLMSRTLSMYAYFRMSPVFRIQLNATQFHAGQLIVSFDPFSQCLDSIPSGFSVLPYHSNGYATGLPNVKIMASESEPVELCIPFIHPRNYLTTNVSGLYENLGQLRISVLNQLRVVSGATPQLTVTVWLYARDASVHIPMYYHSLQLPELVATSLTSSIGNMLTSVTKQSFTGGLGLVSKLLSLDYPSEPINVIKTVSPVEPLSHCKGVSRARRMAVDPDSGHIDDVAFEPMKEDMDLLKIAQRPMLLDYFTWTTSQTVGTKLTQLRVEPYGTCKTASSSVRQPTFLCYVSQAFTYWRGSIIYDIEFVATKFHSGKILVSFTPNDDATHTFAQVSTSNPSVIVDLQQTSSVSFTVPYISPTPLKFVDHKIASAEPATDAILGYLDLYVQNTLAAASNVTNNVDINIYVRAGPDFELFVPCAVTPERTRHEASVEESFDVIDLIPTSDTGVKLQTNRMDPIAIDATMAMGSSQIKPRPRFGETYSLMDLIKRYNRVDRTQCEPDEKVKRLYVTPMAINPFITTDTFPYDSYLSYFAQMYAVWSGSMRYKFVGEASANSTQTFTAVHVPANFSEGLDSVIKDVNQQQLPIYGIGLAHDLTHFSQDTALELEVPFYSPFNFHLTLQGSDNDDIDISELPYYSGSVYYGVSGFTETDKTNVCVYVAAGDDFRLGYLRPPPTYYNLPPGA